MMVWDKIAKIGTFTDMNGNKYDFSRTDLELIARNYQRQTERAPLVFGHPQTSTPAMGWIKELRVNGDYLEAEYEHLSNELKNAVNNKEYRYKSISLDKANMTLRHLGLLGGVAPAMSGLGDIQFSQQNEVVTLYFAENEVNMEKTIKELEQLRTEIESCKLRIETLRFAAMACFSNVQGEADFSAHRGVSPQKMVEKL